MYRCQICNSLSRPNQPRLTYCIHRLVDNTRMVVVGITTSGSRVLEQRQSVKKDIAMELGVCENCFVDLKNGADVKELLEHHYRYRDRSAPLYREGERRVMPKTVQSGQPHHEDQEPEVIPVILKSPEINPVNKPVVLTHRIRMFKAKK